MDRFIEFVLVAAAGYLGVGVLVTAALHVALARLDPAARGAGLLFRLLITPGLVALWPVVARRWYVTRAGGTWAGDTERVSAGRLRAVHGPLAALSVGAGVLALLAAWLAVPPAPVTMSATDSQATREPLTLTPVAHGGEASRLDPGLRVSLVHRGAALWLEVEIPLSLQIPGLALYWMRSLDPHSPSLDGARLLGAAGRSGIRHLELPPDLPPNPSSDRPWGEIVVASALEQRVIAVASLERLP